MTVCVCLDEKNGMQFNRRRQSRDRAVLEDMAEGLAGALVIDSFSEKLIQEAGIPCVLAPEQLKTLPESACFFAEDRPAEMLAAVASRVVVYRWNRHYPADVFWTVDLQQQGFALKEVKEFPGNSHESITKEVYVR